MIIIMALASVLAAQALPVPPLKHTLASNFRMASIVPAIPDNLTDLKHTTFAATFESSFSNASSVKVVMSIIKLTSTKNQLN